MKSHQTDTFLQPPDGGYGWIIVCCSAMCVGFASSVIKTAGIVYANVLMKYPQASRELVGTMTTLVRGVMFLTGIFSVQLAQYYSYKVVVFIGGIIATLGLVSCAFVDDVRLLVFTFGGITGIGTGLVHAPCIAIVGSYFTRKRSTAMGLMLCGSGIVIVFIPPSIQFFINVYGLNGALLLWGGLTLHTCIFAQLLRQPIWIRKTNESNTLLNRGTITSKFISDLFILKDPIFLLLLFNRVSFFFNNVAVPVIIPDFIQEEAEERINMDQSALLLSSLAFGDLISRGVSGFFLDYFSKKKKLIYLIALIATAWNTFLFQWSTSLLLLLFSCVFYGVITGIDLLLTYLLVFDFFPERGEFAHALQQSITGLSLFLEGPVIGGLWRLSSNYSYCWDFLGLIILLSVIAWTCKTD